MNDTGPIGFAVPPLHDGPATCGGCGKEIPWSNIGLKCAPCASADIVERLGLTSTKETS